MRRAPLDRVRSQSDALGPREYDERRFRLRHARLRHDRLRRQRLRRHEREHAWWLDDDADAFDDLAEEDDEYVRDPAAPIG